MAVNIAFHDVYPIPSSGARARLRRPVGASPAELLFRRELLFLRDDTLCRCLSARFLLPAISSDAGDMHAAALHGAEDVAPGSLL